MEFPCTQLLEDDFGNDGDSEHCDQNQVATLIVEEADKLGIPQKEYSIFEGDNIIGRHENCHISIPSAVALSKKHACFEADKSSCCVYDCGSANKSRLGSLRLKPEVRYRLQNGDVILFANVRCTFKKIAFDVETNSPAASQVPLALDTPMSHMNMKNECQKENISPKKMLPLVNEENCRLDGSESDLEDTIPCSNDQNSAGNTAICDSDETDVEDEVFARHSEQSVMMVAETPRPSLDADQSTAGKLLADQADHQSAGKLNTTYGCADSDDEYSLLSAVRSQVFPFENSEKTNDAVDSVPQSNSALLGGQVSAPAFQTRKESELSISADKDSIGNADHNQSQLKPTKKPTCDESVEKSIAQIVPPCCHQVANISKPVLQENPMIGENPGKCAGIGREGDCVSLSKDNNPQHRVTEHSRKLDRDDSLKNKHPSPSKEEHFGKLIDDVENCNEMCHAKDLTHNFGDTDTTDDMVDTGTTNNEHDTDPANDLPDTDPVNDLPDTDPVNDLSDTDPVNDLPDTNPVNDLPDTNPVNDLPDTDPANDLPDTNPVNDLPDTDPVNDLPDTDPVNDLPDTDPANDLPDTDPVNDLPDTDPVNDLPDTDPVNDLPDTDPVNDLPDTDPVNDLPDTDPANDLPDTDPVNDLPDTNPVNNLPDTDPVNDLPDTDPVNDLPDTDPGNDLPDTDPVNDLHDTEPVNDLPDTNPVNNLPDTDPVNDLPDTEPVNDLPDTDPVNDLPDTDPVNDLHDTDPVNDLHDTEPVIDLPDTEPVNDLPDTEPVNDLPDTEPVNDLPDTEPANGIRETDRENGIGDTDPANTVHDSSNSSVTNPVICTRADTCSAVESLKSGSNNDQLVVEEKETESNKQNNNLNDLTVNNNQDTANKNLQTFVQCTSHSNIDIATCSSGMGDQQTNQIVAPFMDAGGAISLHSESNGDVAGAEGDGATKVGEEPGECFKKPHATIASAENAKTTGASSTEISIYDYVLPDSYISDGESDDDIFRVSPAGSDVANESYANAETQPFFDQPSSSTGPSSPVTVTAAPKNLERFPIPLKCPAPADNTANVAKSLASKPIERSPPSRPRSERKGRGQNRRFDRDLFDYSQKRTLRARSSNASTEPEKKREKRRTSNPAKSASGSVEPPGSGRSSCKRTVRRRKTRVSGDVNNNMKALESNTNTENSQDSKEKTEEARYSPAGAEINPKMDKKRGDTNEIAPDILTSRRSCRSVAPKSRESALDCDTSQAKTRSLRRKHVDSSPSNASSGQIMKSASDEIAHANEDASSKKRSKRTKGTGFDSCHDIASSRKAPVCSPSNSKSPETTIETKKTKNSASPASVTRSIADHQSGGGVKKKRKTTKLAASSQTADDHEKPDDDVIHSATLALRPRKVKPKVMFTGVIDKVGEGIVKELGGHMTDDVLECTHLVTDKMRRTVKFLCAVVRGIHIVTQEWLRTSRQHRRFLNEDEFELTDDSLSQASASSCASTTCPANLESLYSFKLSESLAAARARSRPLFDGCRMHVTASVLPPPEQMYAIVECGGGECVVKLSRGNKQQRDLIVVSTEEDERLCANALKNDVPVVSKEFVLTGILRQKLELEKHRLFVENREEKTERTSNRCTRGTRRESNLKTLAQNDEIYTRGRGGRKRTTIGR